MEPTTGWRWVSIQNSIRKFFFRVERTVTYTSLVFTVDNLADILTMILFSTHVYIIFIFLGSNEAHNRRLVAKNWWQSLVLKNAVAFGWEQWLNILHNVSHSAFSMSICFIHMVLKPVLVLLSYMEFCEAHQDPRGRRRIASIVESTNRKGTLNIQ